jgi:hypothetical protein
MFVAKLTRDKETGNLDFNAPMPNPVIELIFVFILHSLHCWSHGS